MKKSYLLGLLCISSAVFAQCQPEGTFRYAVSGKADGEMVKTVKFADNNILTISSNLVVKKFMKTITIDQVSMGSVSPQTGVFRPSLSTTKDSRVDDGNPVDVTLGNDQQDNLSLAYGLGCALQSDASIPQAVMMLQQGAMQSFQVNEEKDVKLDDFITTKITVQNDSNRYTYWFAPMGEYETMVQSEVADKDGLIFHFVLQMN